MKILRNKKFNEIVQLKAREAISDDLYRALYEYQLTGGLNLDIDKNSKGYITSGYEGNPDIFGITNKIANMFSNVEIKAFKLGTEDEVDNPLLEFFQSNSTDYTFEEFLSMWELFCLIEGNGIDYIESLQLGGNNNGKIKNMDLVPPQNVEIKSGGWRDPIESYMLDFNKKQKLKKEFIYHTRMFPNLDFTGGKRYMGISPVKVAVNIINAQNNGYSRLATLLKKGAPPGILSKNTEGLFNMGQSEQQRGNMEKQWKRKYTNPDNAFLPLFTMGDIRWQNIGISSMKDLQVLESSVAGMRVLCRIWGVPSQAFGDTEQSTYNNMGEAKKAVYEDRIMPDMRKRLSIFNRLLGNEYYKIELKPDYSNIPCLQDDMKKKAEILQIENLNRSITTDEFREDMGRAPMDEQQRDEMGLNEPDLNDDELIY